MKKIYKIIIIITIILIVICGAYSYFNNTQVHGEGISYNTTTLSEKLSIDMNNWNYDKQNDIYYQIGLVYCANPVDSNYESCGIYIPGKYFNSTLNSNGTYTCTINENNQVGNYTSKSAPIVMPINTP